MEESRELEPAPEKTSIQWMLEVVGAAFIAVCVENLWVDYTRAAWAFFIGAPVGLVGLKWESVRIRVAPGLRHSAELCGSDFRVWLVGMCVIFFYVGYPAFKIAVLDSRCISPASPALTAEQLLSAPTTERKKAASVLDYAPLPPNELTSLTNEQLRIEVYKFTKYLDDRERDNIGVSIDIGRDERLGDAEIARRNIANDENLSRSFKTRYKEYCLQLQKEMARRLPPGSYVPDIASTMIGGGLMGAGIVGNVATDLHRLAQDLP